MEAEKRWVSCSWYHQWAVRFIGARRRRPRTPGCRKRPVPEATRGAGRDGVHRNAIGWGPGHMGCGCGEAAPLNPSSLCHPGCSCGRPSSPARGVQTDSGYEWGGRRDRGGEAVPGAALRVWENGTVPPPARPVPSDPGRVPPVPSLAQPGGGAPHSQAPPAGGTGAAEGSPGWLLASRGGAQGMQVWLHRGESCSISLSFQNSPK